jgi:hypothetical protein
MKMLKIEVAKEELSQKNFNQIQTETAWKWASRAAASFENCLTEKGSSKFASFVIGEEYFHEAVEHAALVQGEDLTAQVKDEVFPYQQAAADDIDKLFGGTDE